MTLLFIKINTDLDIYYINPHNYKFNDNKNIDLIDIKNNDINEIVKNLTSVIMSNSIDYENLILNQEISNVEITTDYIDNNLFKLVVCSDISKLENILKNDINDINIQDEDGDTPLHLSVFLGNFDACNTLLLNGASLIIKDKWNQIPIQRICFCSGDIKIIKIVDLFNFYQKKNKLEINIFNFVDNYRNTTLHLVLIYLIKNKIIINNNQIKLIKKLKKLTDNKIINNSGLSIKDLLQKLNTLYL